MKIKGLQVWAQDSLELLFPRICPGCSAKLLLNEVNICIACMMQIPETTHEREVNNELEQSMAGRIPFDKGAALFYFDKGGIVQQIVHSLKYRGHFMAGHHLGMLGGRRIKLQGWAGDACALVPVPLHPDKQAKRGYNQSDWIAKGLSVQLNIPVNTTVLKRVKNTNTQTRKSRTDRWSNINEAFEAVADTSAHSKHYILVDDVLTTGATLEAAGNALLRIPGCRISFISLAMARLH